MLEFFYSVILPAIIIGVVTTIIIIVAEINRIKKSRNCEHKFKVTEIKCTKCGIESYDLDD